MRFLKDAYTKAVKSQEAEAQRRGQRMRTLQPLKATATSVNLSTTALKKHYENWKIEK
jgi:hypothetical protein